MTATMPEATTGTLYCLDRTGDSRFSWDPNKPEEVTLARQQFESLKAKGYLAYKVDGQNRRETMHEFDPAAREIVMSPQTVGG